MTTGSGLREFIHQIEPFLYGRPITYVDVGAYAGDVLAALIDSAVKVRSAHLIEPNPANHRLLLENRERFASVPNLDCHELAISDTSGVVSMRDQGTMSQVVGSPTEAPGLVEVPATTLDDLAHDNGVERIDLLKVDVEGHELKVIAGAKELLSNEAIDVVYIEAGMDPGTSQQVYYRSIEDALNAYGYKLFRVHEQTHEWPTDAPFLRRANLCFMSGSFASGRPFKLSRELMRETARREDVETRLSDLEGSVEKLEQDRARLQERASEAEAAVAEAERHSAQLAEVEARLRRAEAERDAFVKYGDDLERQFKAVLRSSSWRVTGSLRMGGRAARQALGKTASPRLRLPQRPALGTGAAAGDLENAESIAREILALLNEADYPQLFALKRRLESMLASDEGRLGYWYLLTSWARPTSTFGFGAQAADAILQRYRERPGELRAALGERFYRRFLADSAAIYTRVGRYSDARALVDREIAAGYDELRALRAEISWIHDPDLAADDLRRHIKRGGRAGTPDLRLHRHLMTNVLGTPDSDIDDGPDGELRLVDAIAAARGGRHHDYRRLVNAYFADQGRAAVLDLADKPFAFDALTSSGATASDGGPLVTVIMTTFDSELTLHYAVDSILNQTHENIELIVVDDGSTDSTWQLLTEIEKSDDRVKLIFNEQNLGTYGAKNLAMEVAQGEFVTFHDSDDWAHPERLQVHLDAMESSPERMVTRSMWLRVAPDGEIDFRRWQKRLAHPNPASVFLRRQVIDKIGYFDTVRFGADSEYWYRAQRVFGRAAVVGLRECLGLGRHHTASLTRSGLGGRDAEEYSAIRAAYQYSWFEWHAGTAVKDLRLDARPDARKFWVPDGMAAPTAPHSESPGSLARCYPGLAPDGDASTFMFGISFASKRASGDWAVTEKLLARTLRSVLNQSDGRWRVIVCGHDRPNLPELADPRVMFVEADLAPPANSGQYRKDKMWKRRLAGSILRDLGGGYFCPLDADDLVHRDLVKHVLDDDNRRGYHVEAGYVEDLANERLAPVPGAWSASFDRVCGSSAVIYFEDDDLPRAGENEPDLYFNLFGSHAYWPIVAEEWGRPLARVPFAAAVYVVNHSQNLSFGLQRSGDRAANIVSAIERHAVDGRMSILSDEFGQVVS